MIWASGSAKAAAGIMPQASAAARPRRRSDPCRLSLMVVLLLSSAFPARKQPEYTPNVSLAQDTTGLAALFRIEGGSLLGDT